VQTIVTCNQVGQLEVRMGGLSGQWPRFPASSLLRPATRSSRGQSGAPQSLRPHHGRATCGRAPISVAEAAGVLPGN
jgi:hypothetical protein